MNLPDLLFLAEATSISPMVALLALVLGSVVIISLILIKIRQSLLVGYFLCGLILANSHVSGLFGNDAAAIEHAIDTLSELGIVLLMFTLGIEFSIRELIHLRRIVLIGGTAQVVLCTVVGLFLLSFLGIPGRFLLVVAFALALSSTAVSIKSFQDMGISQSPGARMTLGISIYQDLAVIVFMVLLPTILGQSEDSGGIFAVFSAIGKGVIFLALCLWLSRKAIPKLFHAVAITRSRELFTVLVVALCALIAWGANWIGLSLALGAFAAGLVVSESIYSHRVLSEILPFKDLFLTIFFVSVGLMINVQTMFAEWFPILLGVTVILCVKGCVTFGIASSLGLNLRQALLAAAALSSSGEFSLVLLSYAGRLGGLSPVNEQILLACTAVSMGLVPSLMKQAIPASERLKKIGLFRQAHRSHVMENLSESSVIEALKDHVIICGYGPVGRALAAEMAREGVDTIIVEMNPTTVRELHRQGAHVLFADATKIDTMKLANASRARAIAFTFPEPSLAVEGIRAARYLNPEIVTFARAKFLSGVNELRNEGVSHILHDEAISASAMIEAVLSCFGHSDPSHSE